MPYDYNDDAAIFRELEGQNFASTYNPKAWVSDVSAVPDAISNPPAVNPSAGWSPQSYASNTTQQRQTITGAMWPNETGGSVLSRNSAAPYTATNTLGSNFPYLNEQLNYALQNPVPDLKEYQTYSAPAYDQSKVRQYASKYAAPYNAEIRRAIQKAIVSSYGLPLAAGSYKVGQAMEKGAEGFSKIGSMADEAGVRQYQPEYLSAVDAAKYNNALVNQKISAENQAMISRHNQLASIAIQKFMSQYQG